MRQLWKNFESLSLNSWITIIGIFCANIAKYMVIPFISIYLVTNVHFTVGEAGMAVASRMWGQRGFTILGGPLTDKLGSKLIMNVGLITMAISYSLIAYCSSFFSVIACILISGFGGACHTVATKSIITKEKTYQEKVFAFSLRTTAVALGGAIGPFLGTAVFLFQPKFIFIFTAICLIFLSVLNQIFLSNDHKKIKSEAHANKKVNFEQLTSLLNNRIFLKILLVTMLFYIFYIQFEVTFPLFANAHFFKAAVAIMFLINAIVTVGSQVLLSNFIAENHLKRLFTIGMLLIGLAFTLIYFSYNNELIFFTAIILFSYGEMLILPKVDSEVSTCISSERLGTAFGICGLASALGCAIGGSFGGKIYGALQLKYWLLLSFFVTIMIFIYYMKDIIFKKKITPSITTVK